MDKTDTINLTYTGYQGLVDMMVLNAADDFRMYMRRWKKHVLNGEYGKLDDDEFRIWENLTFFINGSIEVLYPNDEVNGYTIYNRLLKEWIDMQNELCIKVDKPNYVTWMENKYNGET